MDKFLLKKQLAEVQSKFLNKSINLIENSLRMVTEKNDTRTFSQDASY